jgi:type II secretory pathway pseudopilin PulG
VSEQFGVDVFACEQEAAAAAANKKAQEVREKSQQAQASMAMGQQQAMGAQQKAGMPGQQQPKSYLSQFRNDKDGDGAGGSSQGSSDLQLSQDDRLSQDAYEKMAGVDGLDAGLGDDKADKLSQLAFLEASFKMIPDFEHDRSARDAFLVVECT